VKPHHDAELAASVVGVGESVNESCAGWFGVPLLSVAVNECGPTRYECKPRITHVGSGANNMGREHAPESMIVGQERFSMASPASNECEPLHLGIGCDHRIDALIVTGIVFSPSGASIAPS
jgi:hypothetical protein